MPPFFCLYREIPGGLPAIQKLRGKRSRLIGLWAASINRVRGGCRQTGGGPGGAFSKTGERVYVGGCVRNLQVPSERPWPLLHRGVIHIGAARPDLCASGRVFVLELLNQALQFGGYPFQGIRGLLGFRSGGVIRNEFSC